MSRTTFIKKIEEEINKLNMRIDLKIIRGKSYAKEARRHKFLLSQMNNLRKDSVRKNMKVVSKIAKPQMQFGWFSKTASFVRMFMF